MFLMRYPGGLAKALTFSYDDGVEQDVELIRIFDQHGMKCTFNLNSGLFAPEDCQWPEGEFIRRMPRKQCIDLYKNSPHEVAVHCLTHQLLTEAPTAMILNEVLEDRKNLERDFGGIIRGMAYPYGPCDRAAVDALRSCGILFARTVTSSRKFDIPEDWLRLPPTCHHDDPRLMTMADKFINRKESNIYGCWLFYVWGHSYEFERDDNWHIIWDFCEKMAGKDDIWYATNSEIFEYVEAWKSLRFSADGKTVFNPTVVTLWFKKDQEIRTIGPGEMLQIDG